MIGLMISPYRNACLRAVSGALLVFLGAACTAGVADSAGPSSEAAVPADSVATTAVDSTVPGLGDSVPPSDSVTISAIDTLPALPTTDSTPPSLDNSSTLAGIAFGTFGMDNALLGSVHTGSKRSPGPTNIILLLSGAHAKGARLVISMMGSPISNVKNADGTFSLTKWKAKIATYKAVDFSSYVKDGTVLVHYLVDEPHQASKWGGKIIPQSTVEEMARYSKGLWPEMATVVRALPSWLAAAPITYTSLDAAWMQYRASLGDAATYTASETAAAKRKNLGIIVGMNVIDGGNGSSGIRGSRSGLYSMSAAEITKYGTIFLNNPYACGFMMWEYRSAYYGRSDVKSAMAGLSTKAKGHARTSCRQ